MYHGQAEDVRLGNITNRLDRLGDACVGCIRDRPEDVFAGKVTGRLYELLGIYIGCITGRSKSCV